jgi:DNA-binding LytR/AlgR family response regulator
MNLAQHQMDAEECVCMLKIAILEDQPEQAAWLSAMLKRYADAHDDFSYTLQHYDQSIQLLTEYRCDTDMLFLDIQLPDMLGIEVARKIRAIDDQVMIIFVTMLTQYAIEGYSVGAFDYVLKPVRYDEFTAKLDRARRLLSHRSTAMTIDIRTKEDFRRVSVDDVTYIEVSNHDVMIHTPQETYKQWGNLKTYEEMLSNAHFVRCNACYLVNLKYVKGIHGDQVQVHQAVLTISKSKRKDFMAAVARYKGGSR